MMEESEPVPKTKVSLKDGNKPSQQCDHHLSTAGAKGSSVRTRPSSPQSVYLCALTTKSCSKSKAAFLLSPWSPLLPSDSWRKVTGLLVQAKSKCSASLHQEPKNLVA